MTQGTVLGLVEDDDPYPSFVFCLKGTADRPLTLMNCGNILVLEIIEKRWTGMLRLGRAFTDWYGRASLRPSEMFSACA